MTSLTLWLLVAVAGLVRKSNGFWRSACSVVQTGRIDTILSPGNLSAHVHKISGASNIDWYSNNVTLQTANCTSCEVQDDKSAYWTPQLYYQHSNGSFEEVPNYGMTVYYLASAPASNSSEVVAFPPGFKMLSGDSTLRSFDNTTLTFDNSTPIAKRVSFHCIGLNDTIPEQPYMFRTDCYNGLRAQILFPSCWDGQNLYLPNSSHVAYQAQIGNGGCPPTHPRLLPLLFFEVLYWTVNVDQSTGGQFVFAQGDHTGYGFHGDFVNGWTQEVLETAVRDCLSLISNPNGTVSTCAALTASDNVNFPRTCPEQPSFVAEPVHGLLRQLPGCNPVTPGPARARQEVCGINSTSPLSALGNSTGGGTLSPLTHVASSFMASTYTITTPSPFSNSLLFPNTSNTAKSRCWMLWRGPEG